MADNTDNVDRRSVLKLAGTGGLAAVSGCVGLSGNGGSDGGGSNTSGANASGSNATGSSASGSGGSGPDTVVFGQPASLTGQWDFLQPGISQATDAAVQGVNEAGGPLDAELEVVRRDTAVSPQEARTVVTQLVQNDDVTAIIGLFSSELSPLFDFLQEQRTPVVTPWPGTPFLDTRGGDKNTPEDLSDDGWIWRTVVGDTVHTSGAALRALDQGYETIGVINGSTEGARSYANAFISAYEDGDGTVASRVEVSLGQSSYQSSLDRLFGNDFGAFLVSMPLEDATTLLSDWADGGYGRQPILSDTLAQDDLIAQVGSDLNGAWVANPGQSGPNYDTMLNAYQNNGDAEINAWTPPAWDATQITALAVQRAGEASAEAVERNLGPVSRGEGVEVSTFAEGKEALDNGEEINYVGASTPVNFTQFGNVFGSVAVNVAQGGEFAEEETISASEVREFAEDGEY